LTTDSVVCHQPPVELGSPQIDIIRQQSEDRLTAVIGRHPQLVALLCGHAHTVAATTCAGLPAGDARCGVDGALSLRTAR
jgi:3',5'-cyclic AMP phosphodiesterase CpdA